MLTHPEDHVIDYYPRGVPERKRGGDRQVEDACVSVRWDDASVVGDLYSKKYDALSLHDLCLLIREIPRGDLSQPDLILTYTAPKAPLPIAYQLCSPREYCTQALVLSMIKNAEQGWDHEVRRYLGWEHSE